MPGELLELRAASGDSQFLPLSWKLTMYSFPNDCEEVLWFCCQEIWNIITPVAGPIAYSAIPYLREKRSSRRTIEIGKRQHDVKGLGGRR